jgi:heme exporter protein D
MGIWLVVVATIAVLVIVTVRAKVWHKTDRRELRQIRRENRRDGPSVHTNPGQNDSGAGVDGSAGGG